MKKISWLFTILLLTVVIIAGCGKKEAEKETTNKILSDPYTKTEFLLGTVVKIRVYDEGKEETLDKAMDRIKELEKQITVNQEGSEVDEINLQAGKNPVVVSQDVYDLVDRGIYYSDLSDGGFDLSVGPITSLWHIGFDDARKPEQAEIDAALPLINYQNVTLNKEDSSVYLTKEGMELDLGAIAKGYITDEVVELLKAEGVTTAIVDLGGNIYVLGDSPKGGDWTVGVQDPDSSRGAVVGTLPESNKSIVTSGIYERYLEIGGEKYHHLLNPKDGYPFDNDIAGVTIISELSVDGDGLSTAVFSKGIKDGYEFLKNIEGVEAVFVSKNHDVYVTPGIKDSFKVTNADFTLKDIADLEK